MQESFEQLKSLLSKAPILVFPNFEKEFIIETDASLSGLGALAQKQDNRNIAPIAYASRNLQKHEWNYDVTKQEALEVVWGVKYFCLYLYGHKCLVITDHEALVTVKHTTSLQESWLGGVLKYRSYI